MENETFWVVWREGDRAPAVKHESYTIADDEANRLAKANPGQVFYVLRRESRCFVELDPIKRVWEKYRHLNGWLSTPMAGPNIGRAEALAEFWQAIKESQEGKEKAL